VFRSTTTKSLALILALAMIPAVSRAQTPEELKQARELFQQAYKDEQEKRFADALEKFRKVAAVKETPAVRYRIGAVLEGSGRLREARDTFRALAATRDQLKPEEQEIAASAAERVLDLDRRVPKLLVRAENAPPDTRLLVDGAPVPVTEQPHAVELDPGEHLVAATAPGHRAFEGKVTLPERSEVPFPVVLEKETPPPSPPVAGNKTLAWIAIGAGAALAITGTVLLVDRESAIQDIKDACPGPDGSCPTISRQYVEDAESRAALFEPLGVSFIAVGAVAVGAGIYLLTRKSPAPAPSTTAWFPRGGAQLGLSGRF
jgi:hypothetical protein